MMLLGIVLHAMGSYTSMPLGNGWPYQDLHTSKVFELPMFVIHLFRMPAFFAVAGFFAALLYDRDGLTGFVRNRAKRVLLPLVIFWATVGPLVLGGFYFAVTRGGRMSGQELIASVPLDKELMNPSFMHLWFLWYLVIFYAATVLVLRLAGHRAIRLGFAAGLTTTRWSLVLWSAMTALTLLPMSNASIDASPLLFPDPRPVIAYGVFFMFGWLLYRAREDLDRLTMWWSARTLGALLAVVAAAVFVMTRFPDNPNAIHVAACVMIGFAIWALVLASFGAFLRYAGTENARVRYLSDASYWMYIVHLPIVIWTAGAIARLPLHAGLKFAIVLSVTTAVCLWTYQAFVRSTFIGQLLNGRRCPSSSSLSSSSLPSSF